MHNYAIYININAVLRKYAANYDNNLLWSFSSSQVNLRTDLHVGTVCYEVLYKTGKPDFFPLGSYNDSAR